MSRLDRYILREYHGPFWFALVVITMVLVVDFVPEVVRMVVSKGLPAWVIIQVFVLNLAWMLALSVPMAVLSGTLMAFGRLSGDSETLAMKAAGISLYRMMAPVLIIAALLYVGLVYFNNNVLPDANHEARRLMSDIRRKRPTLDLKPNVMEDRIPGYHLLIKKIDQKTSDIADITIFEQKGRIEPRTVVAKTGTMRHSEDGATLILELSDGEIHEPDPEDRRQYRRTAFEHETFYLGGIGDEWSRTDSEYRTDREKSSAQMRADILAWDTSIRSCWNSINVACSLSVTGFFLQRPDTSMAEVALPIQSETFRPAATPARAGERANDRARRIGGLIEREVSAINNQERLIDQYEIEIYKKYAIPAACLVFTLIGCPLGVRARRGGIAAGLGFSIGLFLLYWTFLIGGESLADRAIVTPFWAMWSADILIGVVGLVLLWSVTNETALSPAGIRIRIRRTGAT
ncbi:MAG: LptF/LptG family permease [candidate division Zixibacteria bacterium]|nr:LptF/LptG family permease [candidate division Zixibacteria bacterium]